MPRVDFWGAPDTTRAAPAPGAAGEPAPLDAGLRGTDALSTVHLADTLERTGACAVWRGPPAECGAALAEQAMVAAELARRGLRATLIVEPVGGELVARVSVT